MPVASTLAVLALSLLATDLAVAARTYRPETPLTENYGGFDSNLAVAVSSDDRHLYVASRALIEALARDPGSGKLTLVQTLFQGDSHGTQLVDAQHLTISPDGAHVYVADRFAPAVSVFARDPLTGELTFVESETNGIGGVFGLVQARSVAVSPDGQHVYATSGEPFGGGSVLVFARDALTGELAFVDALLDGGAGGSNLDNAEHVTVSPDGASVYVAASSAVSLFSRDALTGLLTFVAAYEDNVGGVDGLSGCAGVVVSPDGAHVYATGNNELTVVAFARDPGTGALTFLQLSGAGLNPQEVAIDATGSHVYVIASGSAAVFARNPVTGLLSFVQSTMGPPPGNDLFQGFGIAVSPGGGNVYTAAAPFSGSVVVFARNASTGSLTSLQAVRQWASAIGLTGIASVVVSGDGADVYAAAEQDGAIVQASRDAGTGALTYVARYADGFDGLTGLALVRGLARSPDDAHVYAAGGGTLTAFARTPGTGVLTVVDQQTDGVAGVDGLAAGEAVVVSQDGAHVYVSAPGDGAVAGFTRDALTGALTFIGAWAGLADPRGLALSPGGEHLYVASAGSDGVGIFSRDAGTGVLTFIGSELDAVAMDGARGIAVSPDGVHVYVGAEHSTSLTTLRRDGTSGLLSVVDVQESNPSGQLGKNGELGWNDLNAPRSILVSGDGTMVLVANYDAFVLDGSVTVFTRDPGSDRPVFVHALYENFVGESVLGAGGYGALAESPDGAHAYWGTGWSHAIVPLTAGFSGCSALPQAGCRSPGAARGAVLKMLDGAASGSPLVSWRWKALGEPTSAVDFGDPTDLTHYGLCAYDESGAPLLVFEALAPAGVQRWRAIAVGPTNELIGFKMRDQQRQPDGMNVVILKAKTPGKARVKVKGKGDQLPVPVLPPGLPLRIQLQTDGAECWEATFSAAGVNTNAGGKFIATSD
jgi:6-phosphogluconolactonase (cycloisomerase 2 family)